MYKSVSLHINFSFGFLYMWHLEAFYLKKKPDLKKDLVNLTGVMSSYCWCRIWGKKTKPVKLVFCNPVSPLESDFWLNLFSWNNFPLIYQMDKCCFSHLFVIYKCIFIIVFFFSKVVTIPLRKAVAYFFYM